MGRGPGSCRRMPPEDLHADLGLGSEPVKQAKARRWLAPGALQSPKPPGDAKV